MHRGGCMQLESFLAAAKFLCTMAAIGNYIITLFLNSYLFDTKNNPHGRALCKHLRPFRRSVCICRLLSLGMMQQAKEQYADRIALLLHFPFP